MESIIHDPEYKAESYKTPSHHTLGEDDYMDDQLIQAAQWKLLRTGDSVEKISTQLGYCDQFYFSRRFRQLSGESPLQFRKKLRAADHWG